MIDKCANPRCDERLVYLRSGLLYAVETHRASPTQRTHFFWICESCSSKYKLQFSDGGAPNIVSLDTPDRPCSMDYANALVRRIFIGQPHEKATETIDQDVAEFKSVPSSAALRRIRVHRGHCPCPRVEKRTCV